MRTDESSPDLLSKYYDWCSALISERLLGMSADEVYCLSVDEVDEATLRAEEAWGSFPVRNGSARVDRAIQRLYRELPRFESWLVQYRSDPAPIDEVLLGFRMRVSQGASTFARESSR